MAAASKEVGWGVKWRERGAKGLGGLLYRPAAVGSVGPVSAQ